MDTKSELSRNFQLEEIFDSAKIGSEEDFDKVIGSVFNKIHKENGKGEFFGTTLPFTKRIYGDNWRKAGHRLLGIIEKGLQHKPDQIGKYFEEVIGEDELEYAEKPKKEILQGIARDINDLILYVRAKRLLEGKDFEVKGLIIYGSYAKNNFNFSSDLDIITVCSGKNKGELDSGRREFFRELSKKIHPDPDVWTSVLVENLSEELQYIPGNSPVVIVTPYPDVRQKMEESANAAGIVYRSFSQVSKEEVEK